MSDGRLQDASQPEAERRVDGGGRKNPLPQSEARRGNAEPASTLAVQSAPMTRTLTAETGRQITIEEQSGAAAAEIMIGDRRRSQQADGTNRDSDRAAGLPARAIVFGALVAGVSAFVLGLRWRGSARRAPSLRPRTRLMIVRRVRLIDRPVRVRG